MHLSNIETLDDRRVDLHLLEIDPTRVNADQWLPVLSPEELARAKSYIFEIYRTLFVARRAHLRRLLAAYLGIKPAEVGFRTNSQGKPFLANGGLWFNLSKSGNRVVIAFTRAGEVGVDLEQVHEIPEAPELAQRWFSEGENAQLNTLPPGKFQAAFFHVWTQKEAYLKARGEGLSTSLTSFSVAADPDKPGGLVPASDDWNIRTLLPDPGWRLAVCVRTVYQVQLNLIRQV